MFSAHTLSAKTNAVRLMGDSSYIDTREVVGLEMEPGRCILFNERTIHHSEPNQSDKRRIGLAVRVMIPIVKVLDCDSPNHALIVLHGEDRLGFNKMIEPLAVGIFGVLSNRSRAAKRIEQLEQAVSEYTQTIGANSTNASAYYNRAMTYRELGEYQKAIEDFTKVIELEPENALAYKYRGLTYAFLGDNERCSEDYIRSWNLIEKQKEF